MKVKIATDRKEDMMVTPIHNHCKRDVFDFAVLILSFLTSIPISRLFSSLEDLRLIKNFSPHNSEFFQFLELTKMHRFSDELCSFIGDCISDEENSC